MSKQEKMNNMELENVAGGESENPKIDAIYDLGMDIDIPGIDQNPKYKCKCSDCGREFWFRQPGSPTRAGAILARCPSCNSTNVTMMKD